MGLSDRLDKANRELLVKRRARAALDEDEETMTYMQRPKTAFINENSHTYDRIGDDSFHVAPSVFDRQAIFHTGNKG